VDVAEVPDGVVTVISTVPVVLVGATTINDVFDTTVKKYVGTVPKVTTVAPLKLVPVTLTTVPPAVEPVFGLTAVTVGAAV
jgi:hypothetical protein